MIGERWSLLILRDAMFKGCSRFLQFQKSSGIATNILAKRLEDFVAAGLMEHKMDGDQAEYVLPRKGLELMPVVIALTDWGDKWVRPGPIAYRDRSDLAPIQLQLRRLTDDKPIDVADVVVVPR